MKIIVLCFILFLEMLYSQEKTERPRPIQVAGDPLVVVTVEDRRVKGDQPEYPLLAKKARIEGTVVFRAFITKEGIVDQLVLLTKDSHPLFVVAAGKALLKWEFKPIKMNGEYVPYEVYIPINFSLKEDEKKKPAP